MAKPLKLNPWETGPVHPRKALAMDRPIESSRSLAGSYRRKLGRVPNLRLPTRSK